MVLLKKVIKLPKYQKWHRTRHGQINNNAAPGTLLLYFITKRLYETVVPDMETKQKSDLVLHILLLSFILFSEAFCEQLYKLISSVAKRLLKRLSWDI